MSGRRFDAIPELVPFGKHVQKLRKAAGLNQEDAAHKMDSLDRGYLSGIENGKRNPSTYQLFKIAKGLGVRPKDLFNYTEANEGAEADYLEKFFLALMRLSESDKQKILKIIDEAENR